jgi:HPt (histidine-containing phosphotransfer) domain-containing protein
MLERLADDTGLADEVLNLYAQGAPAQLATLRAALAAQSAADVQACAHSLKGASANIAANLVYETSWALEQAGAAGDLARVSALLPTLESRMASLLDAVAAWHKRQSSSSPSAKP